MNWCATLVALVLAVDAKVPPSEVDVVVVVGAAGTPEFGERFAKWASGWTSAAEEAEARLTVIGQDEAGDATDRDRLQQVLKQAAEGGGELWLVLIGHGTFDRRDARFNLRGPDFTANDLKRWLSSVQRPTAVIDLSASSAPFLQSLAAPDRVVLTATKSGGEQNFAYFGNYLSQALTDPAADLDKDQQVSLWEAYLFASRRTAEFYQADGRLQTEHALLDDNGDGQGTRSDAFDGLEPVQTAAGQGQQLDGTRAHQWHLIRSPQDQELTTEQRAQRNELERRILQLKSGKSQLPEDEYYEQLERLFVEFASIHSVTEANP